MKLTYLRREPSNTRLILIFAGWGAGPDIVANIKRSGWDIAVAHDYSDLDLDLSFLDSYYTIYLFAWSLGVYAASVALGADGVRVQRLTAAFALNGTLTPVDEAEGIPEEIFMATAANLSASNLKKFRLRMAGSRQGLAEMETRLDTDFSEARINDLRNQLLAISRDAAHRDARLIPLPWTRAYISSDDLIFPPHNQERAWRHDPEVEVHRIKAPHYVPLESIIHGVISDTDKVSDRFGKALRSYDAHAIAQYSAAIKLARRLAAMNPRRGGRILEIGSGTGLFTREYAPVLDPAEATFVDLAATGPFGIAPAEHYFAADAEKWIEESRDEWDVILSTSAIQWFADIPRFLACCYRRLRPGGILAISTFTPGNMEELDSLRSSPIIYPKASMLEKCMKNLFEEYDVTEDCIRVEFKSAREMLMHLKNTGVGGSAPGTGLGISAMTHIKSLTYRPVYITGRKG